jgi:hypothetical protein
MEVAFVPKWIIKIFTSDFKIQNEVNILVSNILICSVFLFFSRLLIQILDIVPHFCIFDKILNVSCPFCGITRSFCELSNGNFVSAFNLNMSSFLLALYFLVQIPLRVITITKNEHIKSINKLSKKMGLFLITFMLLNWLFKVSF